jgi:predicted permease
MLARLRSLWRNLVHRDRVDGDLDHEVNAVFDILVDEKVQSGLSLEQARRAATLELGRVHSITQQVREARTGASIDAIVKDVRYGARVLRANPGFTLVVVLSLGIGIGANSAIFSVANALMLRTLSVPAPGELFTPRRTSEPVQSQYSFPDFAQLRDGLPAANTLAAMSRVMRVQARTGNEPNPANMQLVSGEFFEVLRLSTGVGRLFTADDNRTVGAHPVAVVSDTFWRRRLGAAPDIMGRDMTLNGGRVSIVGVAPPGFTGLWLESPVDVWVPLAMQAEVRYIGNMSANNANLEQPWMPQENIRWLDLLARAGRADGTEAAALNVSFRAIAVREASLAEGDGGGRVDQDRLVLEPYARGASALRTRFRTPLFALMAMVALLLLIACVNTANLMLARAAARQREMAVRLSIGAGRGRIVFQMLIESVLLGTLAAGVGLLMTPFAGEFLIRMTLGIQSGPLPIDASLDGRVLLFTAVITLAASLLCGIVPAWRATDIRLADTLKSQGRGNHGGARQHLARVLVGSQVALSLLLVVAAGLFLRSLDKLSSLPLGFDPARVVSAAINPRFGGYRPEELPALYRRVIEKVEAMPGVESAALAVHGVMSTGRTIGQGFVVTGYQPAPGESIAIQQNQVTPAFLRTIGLTPIAGRDFTERDTEVAIINEAMARRYFDGRDPIGQRFGEDVANLEIIGVVRDARINSVREAAMPMAFMPVGDTPGYLGALQVRTVGDPSRVAASLARAIQEVEPALPVDRITAVTTLVSGTFRQEQVIARLTTVLGTLALGLACLGLYGLMAYTVKRRTSEIGLRFALGAGRGRVLWMVLRESMLLVTAGLAAGLPVVFVVSQLIGGLLFEVPPNDPTTIAIATFLLLIVAAAASYVPARRASRVEPLIALRQD